MTNRKYFTCAFSSLLFATAGLPNGEIAGVGQDESTNRQGLDSNPGLRLK